MNIQDQVQALKNRLNNHSHQTNGFTWDYTAATDEEVLDTTNVFQDTLDGLSDVILQIVSPKDRTLVRKQIAYLNGLRHRQAEAWERYIADCEQRTKNTNQWLLQNAQ